MLWFTLACSSPQTPTVDAPGDPTADTGAPALADDLVVLSLNLRCNKLDGTPFATHAERFAAIADLVVAEQVDAVLLQEVCVGAEDGGASLTAALQEASGEGWGGGWAYAHDAWVGTPDEAQEGLAIYTRRPMGLFTPVHFVSPGVLTRIATVLTLEDGPALVNVHLDYDDALAREDQARQSATIALWYGGPDSVVAGDLNARVGQPAHQAILQMGFEDATAGLDAGHIDHLLVHRGAGWYPVEAREVLEDPPVSDHPGVLVRLRRRVGPEVTLTRLVARVDVGFGHHVSVRGDAAPLSWDRGWWAFPAAADRWELVLTELDAPFAYKFLRDDTDWEQGEDHVGEPGVDQEVSPTF